MRPLVKRVREGERIDSAIFGYNYNSEKNVKAYRGNLELEAEGRDCTYIHLSFAPSKKWIMTWTIFIESYK